MSAFSIEESQGMQSLLHHQPRGLRLGIDGRCLGGQWPRTGVYRYVAELCRVLDTLLPQARFLVYLQKPPQSATVFSDRWEWRVEPAQRWRNVKSNVWLKFRAPHLIAEDHPDVYWATCGLCPRLPQGTKSLVTVHDLNHILVPETMARATLWAYRLFLVKDVLRANAIVANSLGTAGRLKELIGRDATAIVKCAVSCDFQRASQEAIDRCMRKYGIERPYLLTLATREPRKNQHLLIQTFLSMKSNGVLPNHRLVLAGAQGWRDDKLRRSLERSIENGITEVGYVVDDDLPALYSGADVFVFPSVYEGFGIPVMEARACGTPIVATDIPEIREAGGEHAIYIEPTLSGIAAGILAALADRRSARPDRSKLWTWEDSGRILAEVVLSLAARDPLLDTGLRV